MRTRKLVIVAVTRILLCGAWLFFVCISPAQTSSGTSTPPAAVSSAPVMPAECAPWVAQAKPPAVSVLKDVKRIFVESLGEDAVSQQIQGMVVAQLMTSERFVVTENRQKADAFFKGAGLEKTSVESHSYESDTAAGHASGSYYGNAGGFGAAGAAINDSNSSTQTINDARVSVRLVNQDGDVIWATTQESKGAKYKGASADVADKVVKQLMRDVEKAEKKVSLSVGAKTEDVSQK